MTTYETVTVGLMLIQALAIPAALTKWAFRVELRLSRLEGRWNVNTKPGDLK